MLEIYILGVTYSGKRQTTLKSRNIKMVLDNSERFRLCSYIGC